ncbi:MAG: PLP-dependent aminotransferase family protein [Clostridiales bacterium]|nr:PLP-dependent aminotransferase family protein [Clostridiales bacterium]
MLYDFIIINKDEKIPLYRQIYFSIRNSIENGSLKKGSKLPSIRRLSDDLSVSKTTVTGAYEQLCVEGYIKNKPQSGYYVEAHFENKPKAVDLQSNTPTSVKRYFEFDFSGKSIDERVININEWKKYVKEVLNQSYLLTSYGEAQGEEVLRKALQKYSLGIRSVNTNEKNIVVGAGTQPLLNILCMISGKGKRVAVGHSSYVQSEIIFKSYGYEVCYFDSDDFGVRIESLNAIKPNIVLINPNFTNKSGANMPVTRRLELIQWAKDNSSLIIEDDYNGELRYSTHPMPCVQNYDRENTVYLGSFSKVLLPSVRISYMVLPDMLLEEYNKIKPIINQTASKTEQTALARYIDNGKIDVHLRKARRIYLEKSKIMLNSVKEYFKDSAKVTFNETSLYITLKVNKEINREEIEKELSENSVCIMPYKNESNVFGLSFSGIPENKIPRGIQILSKIIY